MCTSGLVLLLQDLDHDPSNPNTRLYATHAAQPYHNDASDIVGKLLLSRFCGAPFDWLKNHCLMDPAFGLCCFCIWVLLQHCTASLCLLVTCRRSGKASSALLHIKCICALFLRQIVNPVSRLCNNCACDVKCIAEATAPFAKVHS